MRSDAGQTQECASTNLFKHTHPSRLFKALIAHFNARLVDLADEAAPGDVLDVGCGEGFVLQYLAKHRPNWRLSGCDLDRDAIVYADQHGPATVGLYIADIYSLPLRSRAFDLVLCSEVLEHLENAPAALAELKRVTRGHVLITVPHEPWFRALARLAVWLRLGPDPEHRQFWSALGFRRLMRERFKEISFAYSSQYQLALGRVFVEIP